MSVSFTPFQDPIDRAEECNICLDASNEGHSGKTSHVAGKSHHVYHTDCIERWLNTQSNCPTCRANVASLNGRNIAQVRQPMAQAAQQERPPAHLINQPLEHMLERWVENNPQFQMNIDQLRFRQENQEVIPEGQRVEDFVGEADIEDQEIPAFDWQFQNNFEHVDHERIPNNQPNNVDIPDIDIAALNNALRNHNQRMHRLMVINQIANIILAPTRIVALALVSLGFLIYRFCLLCISLIRSIIDFYHPRDPIREALLH